MDVGRGEGKVKVDECKGLHGVVPSIVCKMSPAMGGAHVSLSQHPTLDVEREVKNRGGGKIFGGGPWPLESARVRRQWREPPSLRQRDSRSGNLQQHERRL